MPQAVPIYAIDRDSSRSELQHKIASRYQTDVCHLVNTGTQAIYLVLDTLATHFGSGVFLLSKYIYGGTRKKVIPELSRRHPNIDFRWVDLSIVDPKTLSMAKVVFVESCSNPQGYVWDPSNYQHVSGYLVIDNTWLSSALYNPFLFPGGQYKVVIDSCTKYLSGGASVLGSICLTQADPLATMLATQIECQGISIATSNCQIVSKMINSLEDRITRSSHRTQVALKALSTYPCVDRIEYPTDRFQPSAIWLHITTSIFSSDYKMKIHSFVQAANFAFMSSFGHAVDAIDTSPKLDSTGIWIRLSIGYDDSTDISSKIHTLITSLI